MLSEPELFSSYPHVDCCAVFFGVRKAAFTSGRDKYQITHTKTSVRTPARIMSIELWARVTSRGTKSRKAADARMLVHRDQFCIRKSARPKIRAMDRLTAHSERRPQLSVQKEGNVTIPLTAANAMNRKMHAITVTPLGRFMTAAAYSRAGKFSMSPFKLLCCDPTLVLTRRYHSSTFLQIARGPVALKAQSHLGRGRNTVPAS